MSQVKQAWEKCWDMSSRISRLGRLDSQCILEIVFFSQRKHWLDPKGARLNYKQVFDLSRSTTWSSFVPRTHWKSDAPCKPDKTRYLVTRIYTSPILLEPRSKKIGFDSTSSEVPQNLSRFRSFREVWATRALGKLVFAQTCRELIISQLHWNQFHYLERNHQEQIINPNILQYLKYAGSVYCTELELATSHMKSLWPEPTSQIHPSKI